MASILRVLSLDPERRACCPSTSEKEIISVETFCQDESEILSIALQNYSNSNALSLFTNNVVSELHLALMRV